MTKTLSIRFAGLALAAFALTACFAPEDSDEGIDFDVDAEAQDKGAEPTQEEIDEMNQGEPEVIVGACYHGATTQVVPINIHAPRCDLAQLQDVYDWAEADGQVELKEFLIALDQKAKIQCRSYFDIKGNQRWCADVIDRYANGTPLVKGTQFEVNASNYFVAYAEDADDSAERLYWNQMLANPTWTSPPVSLSETGFIMKNGQFKPHYDYTSRGMRLLKFDPRECPQCGYYSGDTTISRQHGSRILSVVAFPAGVIDLSLADRDHLVTLRNQVLQCLGVLDVDFLAHGRTDHEYDPSGVVRAV